MGKSEDNRSFEFDYAQARKNAGLQMPDMSEFYEESGTEKLMRKFKENPFVPFGALVTTACLTLGLMSMRKGDGRASQLLMRGRVLAQGFTLVALVAGLCIKVSSTST